MPELPEIEVLRRSLEVPLVGARLRLERIGPHDLRARGHGRAATDAGGCRRGRGAWMSPRALLDGARVRALHRLGKQLAIEAEDGRVLVVQLGMSGQLRVEGPAYPPSPPTHRHVEWRVERRGTPASRLLLRDPRRFGGVHAAASMRALQGGAWSALGPDALSVGARALRHALAGRRAVKAVLLDQGAIAGVGNIYADEALFRARIHPATPAARVPRERMAPLAAALRTVLRAAVTAGGSSLRDYLSADGACGTAQLRHAVYGRAGEACRRCGSLLVGARLAGRTTVHCPSCQPPVRPGI